ncbi:CsbD family protein [Pararoseomonas sp. SCSIO 73927]|uniref:CsbD family protein n=1 Tax=Pararoseomonas sp. SCSIO 73927 TaxID=3114537 RepID=UPI0030D07C80
MAIDKDRVEGSLKQAGGAIKENVGAAVGDKKMETEGAAQRAEGKVQNAAGGVKDAVRDAANKA